MKDGDSYCRNLHGASKKLLAFKTTDICTKELATSLRNQSQQTIVEPVAVVTSVESDFKPYTDLRRHYFYTNPGTPVVDQSCYSPDHDPLIAKYLQPNKIYRATYNGKNYYRNVDFNETNRDIKVIHCLVREGCKQYGIDPRQVFTNMIGESFITPDIMNGEGSSAYGIIQMLGNYYPRISKRKLIENYQSFFSEISPRVVQVFYYIYEHERRHYESAR